MVHGGQEINILIETDKIYEMPTNDIVLCEYDIQKATFFPKYYINNVSFHNILSRRS